jgi:hypothetical protein
MEFIAPLDNRLFPKIRASCEGRQLDGPGPSDAQGVGRPCRWLRTAARIHRCLGRGQVRPRTICLTPTSGRFVSPAKGHFQSAVDGRLQRGSPCARTPVTPLRCDDEHARIRFAGSVTGEICQVKFVQTRSSILGSANIRPGYNLGPLWSEAEMALLGTVPVEILAKQLGRTTEAVRIQRARRGIASAKDKRRRKEG